MARGGFGAGVRPGAGDGFAGVEGDVEEEEETMNVLLWVLQILAALLYAASGVMKVVITRSLTQ